MDIHLAAYVVSCAARRASCQQTIANLQATDWSGNVTVVYDQSTAAHPVQRITDTGRRLLQLALDAPGWTHAVCLEDDLLFNRHLEHNLRHWRPLREDAVTLASLYNPGLPAIFEMLPFQFRTVAPEQVYGGQAFLISRPTARYLVEHFDEVAAMPDVKFPRLAARLGPIFYHVPSLVQHIGRQSTWGGHFHSARDFDLWFRSETPLSRCRSSSSTAKQKSSCASAG